MKLVSFNFILITVMLLGFPLKSIGQNISEQQLIGTWLFNYEISLELMDVEIKENYEKMDINRHNKIRQVYENRKIIFLADGKFFQELANGKKLEAKWVLNSGKLIDITNSSGHIVSFKIKRVEDNVLVLIPKKLNNSNANKLFTEWYLIRS